MRLRIRVEKENVYNTFKVEIGVIEGQLELK
jgi:hypothetical protein